MSQAKVKAKENDKSKNTLLKSVPDKTLLTIVIFLIVMGLMAIFSAGAPKCIAAGVNPAGFAIKQAISLVVGLIFMKFFIEFDYKLLAKYALHIAFLVIISLCLVNFTPLGITVYGAKRWMMLGPIQFQPSELAKLSVIILLACAFYKDAILFTKEKCLKYYLPILIMMFLVFMQPNLSMVILLCLISLIIYFTVGGALLPFIGIMTFATIILCNIIKPYQLSRIKIWLNPEIDPYGAGYNIIQSLLAFAAGGIWGEGFGNSKQKLAWLPEGHTDFIFAVIGEEMGFIGCVFLICTFAAFIHRGLIISSQSKDMFGKLLAVGITLSIGFQAFINMAVSSSMIPATGVPMPFISYGGTSIVVSLCMVGILLNISRKRIKKIKSYEARRKYIK